MTNDIKQSVEKELAEYKKQNANILGPSTKMDGLSEFHKVIVDSIILSINPVDGDIYKHKDKYGDNPAQYIIAGQGLQRLAVCAGIAWNPLETKATSISQKYVAYNAVGCIRKADGLPTCYQAEYDVDIDVVEDELRDQFNEKKKAWLTGKKDWFRDMSEEAQNSYVEGLFRKELNFKKKHKTKIAATGAKNRVIRALLGVKKTYTIAELKRPFIMPRVILQPDYGDPEVKKQMLAASIQAITGVFGPVPSQAPDSTIDIPNGDYEVRPVPTEEDEPEPSPPASNDGETEKSGRLTKEDFATLPFDEQLLTLEEMAQEKGYTVPVPIKDMDDHNRGRLFDHLDALPVPAAIDDDIPF
jgi:hypothetical protein